MVAISTAIWLISSLTKNKIKNWCIFFFFIKENLLYTNFYNKSFCFNLYNSKYTNILPGFRCSGRVGSKMEEFSYSFLINFSGLEHKSSSSGEASLYWKRTCSAANWWYICINLWRAVSAFLQLEDWKCWETGKKIQIMLNLVEYGSYHSFPIIMT